MNLTIENLNGWGESFLRLAWPMLWQSSLLIALVFALDFLFAKKIRASVRYALWLVVLVKLILPPTLALPTGAAWWLFQTKPLVAPVARNFTVTYDDAPLPADFAPSTIPMPAPLPPKLEAAGWALLASVAVSAGLLLWLMIRWWQVARTVRRATVSDEFSKTLEAAKTLAGLRFRARLKIVEGTMSPAVCGLFRPVILLPRALAEKLSPTQLRAVLLHEIFHLRRRDVWVNCAQALLQIFYWWHPLLWTANARLRRVREEAVDDAVMLALRDAADGYAPTLLEVAKLALRRPLMSLGLVGIMESRSALRQRIGRLVDFRAPRRAGLTFASLCGIFVFSAVALPMGEAPAKVEKQIAPAPASVASQPPITTTNSHPPLVLITAGFYRMRAEDFQKQISNLQLSRGEARDNSWWSASPENFSRLLENLKSSGLERMSAPRVVAISGNAAQMTIGNGTNEIRFDCTPVVTNGRVNLDFFYRVIEPHAGVRVTNQFRAAAWMQDHGGIAVSAPDTAGNFPSNVVAVVSAEIVTNAKSAPYGQRLNSIIKRAGETNSLADKNGEVRGILNDTNFRVKLRAMEQRDGFEKLDEPKAEAVSGRGENRISLRATVLHENLPAANGSAFKSVEGRKKLLEKLNSIRLDRVAFDAVPLGEITRQLAKQSRDLDPERRGINFLINPNQDRSGNPATGLPSATNAASAPDIGLLPLTISPPLTNVALVEVLNALVKQAPQAFRYTIKDYGVVFSPPATNPPQFFTREFKVDTNTFLNGLRSLGSPIDFNPTNSSAGKVSMAARNVFTNVGVNLDSPPGKTVYYNERSGKLLVRATEPDLDFIEKIIYKLNYEPPQIHIKARFMEVPESFFGDATETFFSTALPHSFPAGVTNGIGILTATEAKQFLKELKLQKGFESLGEPEVTSSSGRQCQMRSTSVRTIVTNTIFNESPTNRGSMTFVSGKIEVGPVLDAVPQVLADGYTVSISTVAGVTKFFGYADSTDSTNLVPDMFTNATGEIGALPVNLPAVQLSRATAHKNLWDGQTLVLFPKAEQVLFSKPNKERDARVAEHIRQAEKKSGKKKLVVLVTVEIVDPAGNRVHTGEDLPFAQDKIPVQPGAK